MQWYSICVIQCYNNNKVVGIIIIPLLLMGRVRFHVYALPTIEYLLLCFGIRHTWIQISASPLSAGISWEIKFSELNFLLCKILSTKVIVDLVENVSLYNSKYAINISGFHIASAIPRWFFSAVKTAQIPFTWFWEGYWTDIEYLDACST